MRLAPGYERRFKRKNADPMRYTMPYGMWTCEDGRQVLFDRDYCPIWERVPGQQAERTKPVWVHWVEQQWFYDDSCPPWISKATAKRCQLILKQWGVTPTLDDDI